MELKIIEPIDSLSKAYFRQTVTDGELETFTTNVKHLLDNFNDKESEEHNKNLIRDFLRKTYYADKYNVNTKGRDDLVILHDEKPDSDVAVIIETKKRTNKGEMISKAKPNAKALQELIFYYLRERYTHKQNSIKNLIATNGYQWYIFDEVWFDKNVYNDTKLKKAYLEFDASGNKTNHFYDAFASDFLDNYKGELPCTYVNLEDTFKGKRPGKKEVKALYKLFAPEHLLKKPFANDSNVLNKAFYNELLYILGLEEKKEGGKKLIERPDEKNRQKGTLIENTITRLQTTGKWKKVNNLSSFGETEEKQIFSIALELCINWLNRVLFLKLLEGQLIRYQKTAKATGEKVAFLNSTTIEDYDELNELFFEVLAVPVEERDDSVAEKFGNIPYLNSSLFEISDLEQATLDMSGLKGRLEISILKSTVLKDGDKPRTGDLHTLDYLFRFLDAYDFSSDENDEIQRDGKAIINAAVLGLIFEKINGYKDGSFFTPSFITMYMSRESLRRAVVQKFNDAYSWKCETLTDVFNQMDRKDLPLKEANAVVNSLKICDPAVGSGHFLVSALNELIAIKHELKILADETGKRISGYNITIERDELLLMQGLDFYSYNYNDTESQRVQKALFHEKQMLIENCLFGVDINPKSVMICRLRLWVELLKNAYYMPGKSRQLQTLPNIDINIKCGNSLISRFALDEDLSEVFRKQKFTRKTYLLAVDSYKNATSKAEKEELRGFIQIIKDNFKATVFNNNPAQKALNLKKGELIALDHVDLWGKRKLTEDQVELARRRLRKEVAALETQLDAYKSSVIYREAFEWRFEFPEVLNDEGEFVGFDVIIGNPPYIRQEELKEQKEYFKLHYNAFAGTADLLVYFIEKGISLLKPLGTFTNIISSKFIKASYGKPLREWLQQYQLIKLIDFRDLPVFEEASTYPLIISIKKAAPINEVKILEVENLNSDLTINTLSIMQSQLKNSGWSFTNIAGNDLFNKLKGKGISLKEFVNEAIFYGIKTALNDAFIIDGETRDKILNYDKGSQELIRPFLSGKDIKRYGSAKINKWLILIPKGFTIKRNLSNSSINKVGEPPPPRYGNMPYDDAWEWLEENYKGIANHLAPFREKASTRSDKGDYWWELRACDYYDEFEKKKIVWPETSDDNQFTMVEPGVVLNKTTFFIPSEDLFLLGVLNSTVVKFYLDNIVSKMRGGYFSLSKIYVETVPVAKASSEQQRAIINLVDKIIAAKKANPSHDTRAWENEIDELVFNLYGLTEDEKTIVKGV